MHIYDFACESMAKKKVRVDAQEWIESGGKLQVAFRKPNHEDCVEAVIAAYAKGAVKVELLGELKEGPAIFEIDWLLVHLPSVASDRELLFDMERQVHETIGFSPSIDEGQKYLMIRMA